MYSLSRTLLPALIAEYQTRLPDKTLLAAKLHEFYVLHTPKQETATPDNKPSKRARKGTAK